jgi:hypothetical protein
MQMTGSGRARGAPRGFLGVARLAATIVALAGLAACSTAPQAPQGAMAAATAHGPTVAFDSIDGPPDSIFRQFVQDLNDEATSRQIAMVSRAGSAQYRVRGYMAAMVGKRRATTIAWAFDVYDADQNRALRITGEEPAAGSGRGTWAAADDRVLRKIAKNGMDQLAAFLAAPNAPPAPPPATPAERGPNVAAVDDAAPATLAYVGREH